MEEDGTGSPQDLSSLCVSQYSLSLKVLPQVHREGKVRHTEGTTEATEAKERAEPGEEKENSVAQRPQHDAWMEERQGHLERQAQKPGFFWELQEP